MSLVLSTLAEYVARAERGDASAAATEFLSRLNDHGAPLALALMQYAVLRDRDLDDFERNHGYVYRIRTRWGEFWLAPLGADRYLRPPLPILSPRGMALLGRALVVQVEGWAA